MLDKLSKSHGIYFYSVFRVLVGLLFIQHGAQKLFGTFGGQAVPLISKFGLAGIIELFGGILIALGFLTRLVALISGLEMLVAYLTVHAPLGIFPLVNKGELALLFFSAFLVMFAYGAGKWSLEKALLKKEMF